MAERVYQVGVYRGHRLIPAFSLARRKDGGIRLSDIENVTDHERMVFLAHFGRQIRATTMVGLEQHRRLFKPGSQSHFDHAVHELPEPFALMRRSK